MSFATWTTMTALVAPLIPLAIAIASARARVSLGRWRGWRRGRRNDLNFLGFDKLRLLYIIVDSVCRNRAVLFRGPARTRLVLARTTTAAAAATRCKLAASLRL